MSARLYTIPAAAKALGISVVTVFRRLKDGSIPFVQLGPRRYIPAAFIETLATPMASKGAENE